MSVEAITWALAQPIKHSSAKFVLVVMANRADGDMICWPSMPDICQQTSQDRKTVQENLRRLREAGYIEDTGERKGVTKQVIVYRLKNPEIGHVEDAQALDSEQANKSKNGTVEEAQKRNSTENGTVPKFPPKRPEIPKEQAQFSLETGPKTGYGTIKEPSGKHQGTKNKSVEQSDDFKPLTYLQGKGVSKQVAKDWIQHRRERRASATLTVIDDREAQAGIAGISLEDALKMEASRGWTGFNAEWVKPKQASLPIGRAPAQTGQPQLSDANEEARRLLFGNKQREVIDV